MKNILHHLYYGKLNEANRTVFDLHTTPEFQDAQKAHDALVNSFTPEQRVLFDEYYLANGGYLGLLMERDYANGFQTGFWLAIELTTFEP